MFEAVRQTLKKFPLILLLGDAVMQCRMHVSCWMCMLVSICLVPNDPRVPSPHAHLPILHRPMLPAPWPPRFQPEGVISSPARLAVPDSSSPGCLPSSSVGPAYSSPGMTAFDSASSPSSCCVSSPRLRDSRSPHCPRCNPAGLINSFIHWHVVDLPYPLPHPLPASAAIISLAPSTTGPHSPNIPKTASSCTPACLPTGTSFARSLATSASEAFDPSS